MIAESPAKSKPKLPQSMGSNNSVGYLPPAVPRQREPYLYPFKLPLVALTLTSLTAVALSPFPRYQHLLWMLVFFSSCSLLSVTCQAIRMITTVRKYHNLYSKNAPSTSNSSNPSSLSCSVASSPSSTSLSTKDAMSCTKVVVIEPTRCALMWECGAALRCSAQSQQLPASHLRAHQHARMCKGERQQWRKASRRQCRGSCFLVHLALGTLHAAHVSLPMRTITSHCNNLLLTFLLVCPAHRPGHKKALRSKGHHRSNNVSMDATGDCCDQLESVALVINCEDWSESSGSGTDWAAGPPRWNHVFVIPNYKEVSTRKAAPGVVRTAAHSAD